jgi:hypothetical protein
MIAVAFIVFQAGVIVGLLAHRLLPPEDSSMVRPIQLRELKLDTPRLEWLQ